MIKRLREMTDPQRKPQSLQITERRELSMKIAVAGTGYVGLSMAVLLAQNHEVTAVDVIPEKVELLQKGRSPIRDKEIKEYLAGGRLHLQATLDGEVAYRDAELVIVSTPTNYDPGIHFFDTGSVETVGETVRGDRDQEYGAGGIYSVSDGKISHGQDPVFSGIFAGRACTV